jgi:hypothetical protein
MPVRVALLNLLDAGMSPAACCALELLTTSESLGCGELSVDVHT